MKVQPVKAASREDLTAAVKLKAAELGADLVKSAHVDRWTTADYDEAEVKVYPHSGYLPTDLMPSAKSFIMVAVRHLDGVLDTTTTACRTTSVQGNFGYVYLNRQLNDIAFGLAKWLEEDWGYRAMPLGPNIGSRYNLKADEDPTIIGPAYGLFNMKRGAVLAGLGAKARNGLVASPELGTKMRLGCVITSAPLSSDPLLLEDPCPAPCDLCARVCPTRALTPDGKVDHLRCYSDVGRRGIHYEELKAGFKTRYPADLPGVDHTTNDLLAMEGADNRFCKIACVAFCPLGERKMPDVMRRVTSFGSIVPRVELEGFPPGR
jgi:epoxyqueuosine reductase QueG